MSTINKIYKSEEQNFENFTETEKYSMVFKNLLLI